MIEMMNLVVGIVIVAFFTGGVFCNIIVKKKYNRMFATMKNKGKDKNMLIIERDYRHGYLQDRVERIKVFVEKEYYDIKISNTPLYKLEDFTITSVYFIVLIGLIFTFLLIALINGSMEGKIIEIFFLSILGLVLGTVLMTLHVVLGLNDLRDIFKVNLCNYLENELELFGGVELEDEISTKIQENQKQSTNNNENKSSTSKSIEPDSYRDINLSESTESGATNIGPLIDERMLEEVLEEILG